MVHSRHSENSSFVVCMSRTYMRFNSSVCFLRLIHFKWCVPRTHTSKENKKNTNKRWMDAPIWLFHILYRLNEMKRKINLTNAMITIERNMMEKYSQNTRTSKETHKASSQKKWFVFNAIRIIFPSFVLDRFAFFRLYKSCV